MKNLNCVLRCLFILTLSLSCAPFPRPTGPLPCDEVIWEARSNVGQRFKDIFHDDFCGVIEDVRGSPALSALRFAEGSVAIAYLDADLPDSTDLMIFFAFNSTQEYNTLQTSFQERASDMVVSHMFPLARVITEHPAFFEHDEITHIAIAFAWGARDFAGGEYGKRDLEFIQIRTPRDVLRQFAAFDVSIGELMKQSVFLSNVGRIDLESSDTL